MSGQASPGPEVYRVDAAALERGVAEPPNGRERELVGCGEVVPDTEVIIVDPDLRTPCAQGRVGEIWVSAGVAQGYWKRLEETGATSTRACPAQAEGHFCAPAISVFFARAGW